MNADEIFEFLLNLKNQGIDLKTLGFNVEYELGHGGTMDELGWSSIETCYPYNIFVRNNEVIVSDC